MSRSNYVVDMRHCHSTGTCYDGECEGLHEDPDVRREQKTWQRPEKGKLIIAAGSALALASRSESNSNLLMLDFLPICCCSGGKDLSTHLRSRS